MKNYLKILMFSALTLFVLSFSKTDTVSVGAIGDVKYSVLTPKEFQEKNGLGWVLMDDKIPLRGSKLGDMGVVELPDARGMFIRGLNLNRTGKKADPFKDENPNHEERAVGEYQSDTIKKHNHQYGKYNGLAGEDFRGTGFGKGEINTSDYGGYETRPKNIALYIYIKIND